VRNQNLYSPDLGSAGLRTGYEAGPQRANFERDYPKCSQSAGAQKVQDEARKPGPEEIDATMNNLATWEGKAPNSETDEKFSAVRRAILLAVSSLIVMVAADAWLCLEGIKRYDRWVLALTVTIPIGGAGCLLMGLAGLKKGRSAWTRRMDACSEELKKATSLLHMQLTERKISEEELIKKRAELENRLSALERSKADLQEELDRRKLAEKTLDRQRQELARSKGVLEVHVQERTQAIQQLQRRYELILNSAGEGICGLDSEGRATFVNPAAAKITGWKIDELTGRSAQNIFGRVATEELEAGGTEAGADQILARKDGTTFPAEVIKSPICENGRLVGSVLVFKDITERKRAEVALALKADELARSNAELEQFAFVASHDMQEPLRKIQAFGDRLKLKCDSVQMGDGRDYLERMQNAAARMQTLINDLLAFSRVIRSSEPFVPVDLDAITKEVLNDLEVRIEKSGARVEMENLPTIDADPTQLRQLMQNLISNALKFQPSNAAPVVKIQARALEPDSPAWDAESFKQQPNGSSKAPAASTTSQLYEITVQDNGIGFDEAYREKIFAVFQRLHGRNDYEGTGIGLAVCRRITDRHGGTITARSKVGQGATFIVTLPVHQPNKGNTP
jgi:PAS domain S-box-containing protein